MLLRATIITIFLFILCTAPAIGQMKAQVNLGGYNHVPMVRTPAMGEVLITIEGDSLFVEGEFSDLRGVYWSAFIHYGEIGKTGHRMLRLKPRVHENRTSGVFTREDNGFLLTEAHKAALRRGHMYVNIASNRFQHGEIRGQIPPI